MTYTKRMRTYTHANDTTTRTVYLDVTPDGKVTLNAATLAQLLEFAGFQDTTGTTRNPHKA